MLLVEPTQPSWPASQVGVRAYLDCPLRWQVWNQARHVYAQLIANSVARDISDGIRLALGLEGLR
jgi:hypothetical protein